MKNLLEHDLYISYLTEQKYTLLDVYDGWEWKGHIRDVWFYCVLWLEFLKWFVQ